MADKNIVQNQILLIEDNRIDSILAEKILKRDEQFEITTVTTLAKGLEALSEKNFEAIVLDLNLPDEYGINTFDRVLEKVKNTAIIVLTGLDDRKLGINLIKAGAQDYILKAKISTYPLANSILYSIERQKQMNKLKQQIAEKE